jgi:hypothetical protein
MYKECKEVNVRKRMYEDCKVPFTISKTNFPRARETQRVLQTMPAEKGSSEELLQGPPEGWSHDKFVEKLQSEPQCSPLVQSYKQFLMDFRALPKLIHSQRKRILKFLDTIVSESLEKECFAGVPRALLMDSWERQLLTQVYDSVFLTTEELKTNEILLDKFKHFEWLQERHLDLPFEFLGHVDLGVLDLQKLQDHKAPKDKLNLLWNASQVVAEWVKQYAVPSRNELGTEPSKTHASPGNDFLLPALILVLVKTQPDYLISHIKFIMRFRNQDSLSKGAYQFCLTNMVQQTPFF